MLNYFAHATQYQIMRRRYFLSMAGAVTGGLAAGCTTPLTKNTTPRDRDGDGVIDTKDYAPRYSQIQDKEDVEGTLTPTRTSVPTSTPSPSPTPSPTTEPGPSIQTANLVTQWLQFGDAKNNAINSIGKGSWVNLAVRFTVQSHDGSVDIKGQAEVYDETDNRVGIRTQSDSALTESEGMKTYEWVFNFDSRSWTRGRYTGYILIRDNIASETSQEVSVPFSIVRPLVDDEARKERFEGPNTVQVGETFSYRLYVRNTTNSDSSVVSPVSIRYNGTWSESGIFARINAPANDVGQFYVKNASVDYTGSYTFRLDSVDILWSISSVQN